MWNGLILLTYVVGQYFLRSVRLHVLRMWAQEAIRIGFAAALLPDSLGALLVPVVIPVFGTALRVHPDRHHPD